MAICFNGSVTRSELIHIKMDVDSKAYARHAQSLCNLPLTKPLEDLKDGEHYKVEYTLTAKYIGDVTKALMAVKEICSDSDVVVSASCDDLIQGQILFYEALKQLEAVIREIEKR